MRRQVVAAVVMAGGTMGLAAAQEVNHAAHGALGTVHFVTSCSAAAAPKFDDAVTLLHSFEFGRAIAGFQATLATDPTCAMAEWGIALSRWTNPMAAALRPAATLKLGREAAKRAAALNPKTPREKGYVSAVSLLFDDYEAKPQSVRLAAYRDAMAKLAAANPADTEATIFHAIALAAAASPTDKSYHDQLEAGATLERLWAVQPNHPGLAHYIIHAYDVPALAAKALNAAQRYSSIAPDAPHALHMPSHTFTRVGDWARSIEANLASAAAARRDKSTAEELHAYDYLTYAYLQMGRDADAKRLLDSLPTVEARFDPNAVGGAAPGSAGVFALAAIPARFALERGDWGGAMKLSPRTTNVPYAEAMTHLARAIGAARTGNAAVADSEAASLRLIAQDLMKAGEMYWGEQVRIQTMAAEAWCAYVHGKQAEAVGLMRATADAEDRTEKNAVTPGPLAPAREQLGEMLLLTGDASGALAAFNATLEKEPGRRRALDGVRAAKARVP